MTQIFTTPGAVPGISLRPRDARQDWEAIGEKVRAFLRRSPRAPTSLAARADVGELCVSHTTSSAATWGRRTAREHRLHRRSARPRPDASGRYRSPGSSADRDRRDLEAPLARPDSASGSDYLPRSTHAGYRARRPVPAPAVVRGRSPAHRSDAPPAPAAAPMSRAIRSEMQLRYNRWLRRTSTGSSPDDGEVGYMHITHGHDNVAVRQVSGGRSASRRAIIDVRGNAAAGPRLHDRQARAEDGRLQRAANMVPFRYPAR